MDVSVIIVACNSGACLVPCLESLFRQTSGIQYEVLVFDNASTDGSMETVRAAWGGRVAVLHSDCNAGFARGCNLAARQAAGKYLFFLNPDTRLCNNALKMFYDFMEASGSGAAAAGAPLRDDAARPVYSGGRFNRPLDDLVRQGKNALKRALFLENTRFRKAPPRPAAWQGTRAGMRYAAADYVTGGALFIRTKVFRELGGFDESFFMYFEETDLQKRMSHASYPRFFVEGPAIVHASAKTAGQNNARRIMFNVSYGLYLEKHHGKAARLFYKAGLMCVLLLELVTDVYRRRYSLKQHGSCLFHIMMNRYGPNGRPG